MAKLLKLRRGSTSEHSGFAGAEGEVTVDTDKETLVVHDGSTAGGHPVAAEDMANVSSASIAGRLGTDSIATTKIAAGALPTDVTVADANISGNLTIESADIVDGTIVNADINGSAAIAKSKLAALDIVNADVNASAAIAGTKISPNFGSQNIVTSGTVDGRDVSADGTKLDGIEAGATADQTNAEIKTAYEANSNTNAFTDALQTKLNAIEASATADQTAAEILTAIKTVDGSGSGLDADTLDGEEKSFFQNAGNLTAGTIPDARFPATLPAVSGANLTGIVSFVSGMIIMYNSASAPSGWYLCDGNNGTPDLRDRFIVGAGNSYSQGATGGSNTATDNVSISGSDTVSISVSGTTGSGGGNVQRSIVGGPGYNYDTGATNHTHSFSGSGTDTVSISGSDTVSIDTRSPYYALTFIMKA